MPTASDPRQFFDALRSAAHERVRAFLRADPGLVHATDAACFGATPLVHAAGLGDRDLIDLLLAAGADPNRRNDWWAGGFGVLDDCTPEIADHLLARGATLTPHAAARLGRIDDLRRLLDGDPQLVRQRGGDGQFPLHFAATPEIAELLLDRGAEIDARDLDHASTAAEWRASERLAVSGFLVQRGAGSDPVMAALIGDLPRLAAEVAAAPDTIHLRITRDRFPAAAPAAGQIYLYTVGEGCTLLHAAAIGDQPEVVRWLVAAGADVQAGGGYDHAPPLHAAAWRNNAAAAAALLDRGAEIDAVSGPQHRNEALGWAIVSGAAEVVRVLLSRGAAVRDVHRSDAVEGAAGGFRCFNRRRPLAAWQEIQALIGSEARGRPG